VENTVLVNDIGFMGEVKILNTLSEFGEIGVLSNVILDSNIGIKTEVDIIAITRCGIFIIESKNYCGSVTGSLDGDMWCVRYSGAKNYTVPNPIFQNAFHANILRIFCDMYLSDLKIKNDYIKSIIVFGENTAVNHRLIGTLKGFGVGNVLIMRFAFLKDIYDEMIKGPPCFTIDEAIEIHSKLSSHCRHVYSGMDFSECTRMDRKALKLGDTSFI
jgi:hypothetical protein